MSDRDVLVEVLKKLNKARVVNICDRHELIRESVELIRERLKGEKVAGDD